ncbi:MAG: Crp/Fnr family transcriptional regulator [Nitrospiraceae bacterium]|nr:Crp/Fnr family transcriptional regulator [Nitrospiraceae bacterium]
MAGPIRHSANVPDFYESFFSSPDCSDAGLGPSQAYPPHTEILRQDTPARMVYFVERGVLKLSRIESSGREFIAGLRHRHWIIGVPAVFLGKQYSFTVTTLTSSSLRSISAENFLNLVETDRELCRQMLTMLSQEIFKQGKNFGNLGCLPAIDRLKQLLYDIIIEVQGSADLKQQVKIMVPLKHKEIAQMIAITPEHLSRLLKALEGEGLIRRDGNWLTVRDTEGLKSSLGM